MIRSAQVCLADAVAANHSSPMGLPTDPTFYLVTATTVFVISFVKGGFGGGFATLGIPFLSLVMDPLDAAIVMAPIVALQDVFALKAYPPRTWSMPNLKLLAPALVLGLGVGFLAFVYVDQRIVVLAIATITLVFTLRWFVGRLFFSDRPLLAATQPRLRSAMLWGGMAGFTTFVAHSGGLPLQIYLLRQRLDKTVFAGTVAAFFAMGNVLKIGPYLWLGSHEPRLLWVALVLAPVVPVGVWIGRAWHDKLDEKTLYFVCYALLLCGGFKLLYDGVAGFLR